MRCQNAGLTAYLEYLVAPQIKDCGRWISKRRVKRYRKKGQLTRQVAQMDAKQVALGALLLRDGNLRKNALTVAHSLCKMRLFARSPLAG